MPALENSASHGEWAGQLRAARTFNFDKSHLAVGSTCHWQAQQSRDAANLRGNRISLISLARCPALAS